MSTYWPWWEGAVALALVTLVHTLASGRFLGVSTAWERVVHWRGERRLERAEARFADDRALTEALAAATPADLTRSSAPAGRTDVALAERPEEEEQPRTTRKRPAPVLTQAAFLVSLLLGGWVAAEMSGRFAIRTTMGSAFGDLVTADPAAMVAVLFAGGILVGFGTRLAGGCTSGHGLTGCGLLRPVSLVATAVFFATAVAVSFALKGLI
jgi:hypothetical protein